MEPNIPIQAYTYMLSADKIAQNAAEPRDSSKLLVFREGCISDRVFSELPSILPANSTLIFNNARVIPARLFLQNKHGAKIEVFLLQPIGVDYAGALSSTSICRWQCLVGNSKKWKSDEALWLQVGETLLSVIRIDNQTVEFTWKDERHFADLLEEAGLMPLPPYIKHVATTHDRERYQTVYSSVSGSVAAPTAGLHFTETVLERINQTGIQMLYTTLHVGAGTFMPVKTENAREHPMHREVFSVQTVTIASLRSSKYRIAVGTTSCRVLESIYWCAVNIMENRPDPFIVRQFDYEHRTEQPTVEQAFEVLLKYAESHGLQTFEGATSLMIAPPYQFRVCQGLITNFHQPGSTLLLLIAAFLGEDWKQVYNHALHTGYRFLSYGDSSLLMPKRIF